MMDSRNTTKKRNIFSLFVLNQGYWISLLLWVRCRKCRNWNIFCFTFLNKENLDVLYIDDDISPNGLAYTDGIGMISSYLMGKVFLSLQVII